MNENKYANLQRMRADIQKDRDKVEKMLAAIGRKEEKLKDAEAARILTDVNEVGMSPEQIGALMNLFKNGKLNELIRQDEFGKSVSMNAKEPRIKQNIQEETKVDE